MRKGRPLAMILVSSLFLAACTQTQKVPISSGSSGQLSPQSVMVRVAKQMQLCWFKKRDPALKKYKMASELDSYSGQPRVLIVPRNRPTGLPKLVAQAQKKGGRTQFTTFGPLLNSKDGPRLNASLNAWAKGQKSC